MICTIFNPKISALCPSCPRHACASVAYNYSRSRSFCILKSRDRVVKEAWRLTPAAATAAVKRTLFFMSVKHWTMSRKALEIWKKYIDYIYGLCFKFSQFLFESLCVVFFYVKSGGLFKRFITTEPGGGSGFFDTLTFSKRASRSQKHVKTHVHSCAPTTWQY